MEIFGRRIDWRRVEWVFSIFSGNCREWVVIQQFPAEIFRGTAGNWGDEFSEENLENLLSREHLENAGFREYVIILPGKFGKLIFMWKLNINWILIFPGKFGKYIIYEKTGKPMPWKWENTYFWENYNGNIFPRKLEYIFFRICRKPIFFRICRKPNFPENLENQISRGKW